MILSRIAIIIFGLFYLVSGVAQDSTYVNGITVLNERNLSSAEMGMSYEISDLKVNADVNNTPLEFREYLQYIRYEQSYSKGWQKGFTGGISLHGLLGGKDFVNDKKFNKEKIKYALLLSWNYKKFFMKKSEFIKKGGKFIVPFPAPHIE